MLLRRMLGAAALACALESLVARADEPEQFVPPPEPPATASTSRVSDAPLVRSASQPPSTDAPPAPSSTAPLPVAPETTIVGSPSGVGSQGSSTPGDTLVEGATRVATPLSQLGSSTSVITAEDIQRRQITSVAEALRTLPGVDVVRTGGPGNVTTVFIRGANSDHTKVLLDGIPLNDPISVGRLFDFSTLSVDNIERIEVIRGPQSVLYGSDAIGGVIQIITRKGSGPARTRYGAMGGSFGTSQQSLNLSGGNSQIYSSWGGSYYDTRGFSAADKRLGNTEKDPSHLGTLAGRMGWTPFENFDIDFVFRLNRVDVKIDDGGGPGQDDPNQSNFNEQIATRTQIRYEGPEEIWEQRFSYSTAHHNRKNLDPTDPLHPLDSFFSNFNGFTQLVDWQHRLDLTENNTLVFGASYQQEDGDSRFTGTSMFGPFDGMMSNRQIRDTAVYLQDQVQLADRWFFTAGTRQDHYNLAGTANTYRLTNLFRLPGTETALRGSLGTGFKSPTIFQLYDPFSGNLALQPEESKGWDVGLEQPLFDGDLVLATTYFRNDFDNLIDFDPGTFAYFNIASALSTGVEVSAFARLTESSEATLTYTHLDTLDRATDLPLLRRPGNRVSLALNRRFWSDRLNASTTFIYVDNRPDRDFTQFPAPLVTLSKYLVVNAALTWQATPNWQWFIRGDNLTNEVYQEAFGFGTPGVSGFAGGSVTW